MGIQLARSEEISKPLTTLKMRPKPKLSSTEYLVPRFPLIFSFNSWLASGVSPISTKLSIPWPGGPHSDHPSSLIKSVGEREKVFWK